MSSRKRLMVVLFVLACGLLIVMGPALAARVGFQGNFSEVPGGNNVRVCDTQNDGSRAYAYYQTNRGNYHETYANDNSCNTSDFRPAGINWHQTCEVRRLRPDPCGGVSNH